MTLIDYSKEFNRSRFSDVIVIVGEHRVKCHKIVLCTQSDYFNTLCGPDGKGNVSSGLRPQLSTSTDLRKANRAVKIKLESEDHEVAFLELLRWVYTGSYEVPEDYEGSAWLFHLTVAIMAENHDFAKLEHEATATFDAAMDTFVDAGEVIHAIKTLSACQDSHPSIKEAIDRLEDKHLEDLLQEPEYRSMLENDGKKALRHLDKLNFVVLPRCDMCRDAGKALLSKGIVRCAFCLESNRNLRKAFCGYLSD